MRCSGLYGGELPFAVQDAADGDGIAVEGVENQVGADDGAAAPCGIAFPCAKHQRHVRNHALDDVQKIFAQAAAATGLKRAR